MEPHNGQWELPGRPTRRASPVHLPLSAWRQWEENHEQVQGSIRDEISRIDDLQSTLGKSLAQPSQISETRDWSPRPYRSFDDYDFNEDGVIDREEFERGEREFARRTRQHTRSRHPTRSGSPSNRSDEDDTFGSSGYRTRKDLHERPSGCAMEPHNSRWQLPAPTQREQRSEVQPAEHEPKPSPTAQQVIEALELALADASSAEMANEKEIRTLRQLASAQESKATKAERRVAKLEEQLQRLEDQHTAQEVSKATKIPSHAARQIAELQAMLAESQLAALESQSGSRTQVEELQERLAAVERARDEAVSKQAATADEHKRALEEFDNFGAQVTERFKALEAKRLCLEEELAAKGACLTGPQQVAAGAAEPATTANKDSNTNGGGSGNSSASSDPAASAQELEQALQLAKRDLEQAQTALRRAALDKEREQVRAAAWVRGLEVALNEARAAEAAKQDELLYVRDLAAASRAECDGRISELQQQLQATALKEVELLNRVVQLEAQLSDQGSPGRRDDGSAATMQELKQQAAQQKARANAAELMVSSLEEQLEQAGHQLATSQAATNLLIDEHNKEMAALQRQLAAARPPSAEPDLIRSPTRARSHRNDSQSVASAPKQDKPTWSDLRSRGAEKALRAARSSGPKGELQSRIAELEQPSATGDLEAAKAAAQKSRAMRSRSPTRSALKTQSNRELARAAAQRSRISRRMPTAGALASQHEQNSLLWQAMLAVRNWQASVKWQTLMDKLP